MTVLDRRITRDLALVELYAAERWYERKHRRTGWDCVVIGSYRARYMVAERMLARAIEDAAKASAVG